MGLDIPLNSGKNYPDFIGVINKFLAKDLDSQFDLVYPQLVLAVKWTLDNIILRKLKKIKIMGNKPAMSYVPPFVLQDLPWYAEAKVSILEKKLELVEFFLDAKNCN